MALALSVAAVLDAPSLGGTAAPTVVAVVLTSGSLAVTPLATANPVVTAAMLPMSTVALTARLGASRAVRSGALRCLGAACFDKVEPSRIGGWTKPPQCRTLKRHANQTRTFLGRM